MQCFLPENVQRIVMKMIIFLKNEDILFLKFLIEKKQNQNIEHTHCQRFFLEKRISNGNHILFN